MIDDLRPMPRVTKVSTDIVGCGWLALILGSLLQFGFGGALIAVGLPIMVAAALDRINVALYAGKASDDD